MKYILITLTLSLLLTSCADKNAFDKFKMHQDQELSADILQSSKIKNAKDIEGVVSAIYLNNIYPDVYNENEYFYVYLYQKKRKNMYNPSMSDEGELNIKLNSQLPIEVKKLPYNNRFSHLTSVKSKWQRYYLLTFKNIDKDELNLLLESGQFSSESLSFQKGKQ